MEALKQRLVNCQVGESFDADLKESQWTFQFKDEMSVYAGKFAIVPLDLHVEAIESLQPSEWVKVEDRLPLCYLSGVWDGLCSDNVIVEDKSGRHYIACLNEGILDGSKFQYWYESNDWDITDKCIIKWKSI